MSDFFELLLGGVRDDNARPYTGTVDIEELARTAGLPVADVERVLAQYAATGWLIVRREGRLVHFDMTPAVEEILRQRGEK